MTARSSLFRFEAELRAMRSRLIANPSISGQFQSPQRVFGEANGHPVVEPTPLGIRRIQFLLGQFSCFSPAPCIGEKTPQDTRPRVALNAAVIGVQCGKKISNAAPGTDKRHPCHLADGLSECRAKFTAGKCEGGRNADAVFHDAHRITRSWPLCQAKVYASISATISAICRARRGGTAFPTW